MSFSQAVSGLNAAATNLDVIGNNIANSATYGFKSGTASFADMFAGSKVGLGVKVAGITQDFYRRYDNGTPGAGWMSRLARTVFFRLVDSNGSVFYSRNGQFKLDENRNLVNMQGMQLTGYSGHRYAADHSAGGESCTDHHSEHADGGEIDHHRVNADQPELNGPCTV